ncbi:MAG TPA: hypothetical protein VGM06_17945 [Polyangiaceae bacterium]
MTHLENKKAHRVDKMRLPSNGEPRLLFKMTLLVVKMTRPVFKMTHSRTKQPLLPDTMTVSSRKTALLLEARAPSSTNEPLRA